MRRTLTLILFAILSVPAGSRGAAWERHDNCVLAEDEYHDGDSFHVYVEGNKRRHYIFRLYYVDAPETDRSYPTRIEEQAKYWSIETTDIPALGEQAGRFVRGKLAKPFTVYTRKEDARGRSKKPRYYAMIKTREGWLSEQLISAGYARRFGKWVDELPDGVSDTRFGMRLKKLEKDAQKEGKGAWSGSAQAKPPGPAAAAPEAPALAGREITLDRSVLIYAAQLPLRARGRLPAGNTLRIIEEKEAGLLKVSFSTGGKSFEGWCRRGDLNL